MNWTRRKTLTLAIALAVIGLAAFTTGCGECDDPYWDCAERQVSETPEPPAPTLRPMSDAHCPMDERHWGSGYTYWGVVIGWTAPATVMISMVRRSNSEQPDTDSENMKTYEVALANSVPVEAKGGEALKAQAVINPAGSWIRVRSPEPLEEEALNTGLTSNHHGWSTEIALAEVGAITAGPEADECLKAAAGYVAPAETAQEATVNTPAEDKPSLTVEVAEDPEDPWTFQITVRDAEGNVVAVREVTRQGQEATAGPPEKEPGPTESTGETPSGEEPRENGAQGPTGPTITPTREISTPIPQPDPPLESWGTPPSQAVALASQKGQSFVLTGCYANPTESAKARRWSLMTGETGAWTSGPVIALYAPDGVAMKGGECYMFAGRALGYEEWEICKADPYGGLCGSETDGEATRKQVAVFAYHEGTLTAVRRVRSR